MIRKKKFRPRPTTAKCAYCETSTAPDYKEFQTLSTYMTERGKLIARSRSGLCMTHQRRMTVAVKRARHLARLPFVARLG
jgi:small subunit ribosomal protein S18